MLGREYWEGLTLPPGLSVAFRQSVPVTRRGPGGTVLLDEVILHTSAISVFLLVEGRDALLARDVPRIKTRLMAVIEQRRRAQTATGSPPVLMLPGIATDVARPSLRRACASEDVALFDAKGTILIHAGPTYIHVEGRGEPPPKTTRLFSGKASRILRVLLAAPGSRRTAKALAAATQLSYAYANTVLRQLEREGYVARKSPRTGFYLRDPGGLLRAWLDAGVATAVTAEPFYAPATTTEALARAWGALDAGGVFTLASGLLPDEVHVSGLPHGIYWPGQLDQVVTALRLRRVTPHNFIVLQADPVVETTAGGIYADTRDLPHGWGVSLSQLAVDFANTGGRGPEQARSLLERYVAGLPLEADEP